jgi:methionine-R-sulfoxide reductase
MLVKRSLLSGLILFLAAGCVLWLQAKPMSRELPSQVTVRFLDANGNPGPPQNTPTVQKSEEEWKAILPPEVFRILRSHGTERPFCGTLLDNKESGVYFCAGCDLPLFRSESKFDSGTGWPSFFEPFAKENVGEQKDFSHGMIRTEVFCPRCGGHLGHVFPDGPKPTGLRYCLNSEAMIFRNYESIRAAR